MAYPIVYKKTSTGATQQWSMEIDGSRYRTLSGQVGGKIVASEWKQAEGTNIGRANERTSEQQAIFEVEAQYKKKTDKEYHYELGDIETAKHFLPMLAKEYSGGLDFSTGVWCQPKLDGMRCIATKGGLFSRNGKRIVGCPHIEEALKSYFNSYPEVVFDGELYNHQYKEDFNTIMSNVKKTKPTAEDLAESARVVQYHIYDFPSTLGDFTARIGALTYVSALCDSPDGLVQLVSSCVADSQEELDKYFEDYLSWGYEGQMIRLDGPYVNKRTNTLLKRKVFQTEEYELVDILEGLGNWSGVAKTARLKLPDGREFGAGIAGTREFCDLLLKEKAQYLGTKTTVKFANLTPDGVPRFPIVKEFNRIDV